MEDTKEWAQISCEVPDGMVDAISDFLIELSSAGVGIDNRILDTFSLETLEEMPFKTVTAYFPFDESLADRIREIEAYLVENGPSFSGFVYQAPTLEKITEEDWSTSWKEHFKPARIGVKLVVKPTWEDFHAAADDVVIELDPGMAFGTGTHPTTMLCLAALEKISSGFSLTSKIWRSLDVGTGSGILTIAAAKLGAERAVAIDIDPEAVRVAGENSSLNGVEGLAEISDTPLAQVSGTFDLVLANILAEDLVKMAPALIERLSVDGFLVLSGILVEKEELVTDGFAGFPVKLEEVTREGEWSCIVFQRKYSE